MLKKKLPLSFWVTKIKTDTAEACFQKSIMTELLLHFDILLHTVGNRSQSQNDQNITA